LKTTEITNPPKAWWPGNPFVEPFMPPIRDALDRHLPKGDAWTDIYNRAYEAVHEAIQAYKGE